MSLQNNNYIIDSIQSIELHEIRGGMGDVVLARWEGSPTSVRHLEPPEKPLYRPAHNESVYYKCCYCDVVQKEFHSNCPNCGAPMEVEDEYISKAVPISESSNYSTSSRVASTDSSCMQSVSIVGTASSALLSELRETIGFLNRNN